MKEQVIKLYPLINASKGGSAFGSGWSWFRSINQFPQIGCQKDLHL